MISLTERSRLAVNALAELAQRGTAPVPIVEIAERRAIPLHLLEQLFAALRRAGVLQSQRGVKGGYSFRRPPDEVSLLDVVEVVEGKLDPHDGRSPSGADAVWDELREAVSEILQRVTVADIAEREANSADAPMFYI